MRRFAPSAAGLFALLAAGGAAQAVEYRKLLDFGANGVSGYPTGGVVGRNATIFGATYSNVYRVSASGDYKTFEALHTFNPTIGPYPTSDLAMDTRGFLYGTSVEGGSNLVGILFKVGSIGGGYEVLHNFRGGTGGSYPEGAVVVDTVGNVYGTNYFDGPTTQGMAYKVAPGGTETFLKGFNGPNGAFPAADVIMDAAGNLYGTTLGGGVNRCSRSSWGPGCGVVFKLAPDGTETLLHRFGGGDGASPQSVIMDAGGNLYGTTSQGGEKGHGNVYKISPDNTFQVLHTFTGGSDGGVSPVLQPTGLAIDAAGNLYGTTGTGGSASCNCGVVFELTQGGQEFVLHTFTGQPDGQSPIGKLFLTADGTLYGVTSEGGSANSGTLYAIAGVGKPAPVRVGISASH